MFLAVEISQISFAIICCSCDGTLVFFGTISQSFTFCEHEQCAAFEFPLLSYEHEQECQSCFPATCCNYFSNGALTRRSNRMIIQTIPRIVSQHLVSLMCSKIFCQTWTNLVPVTLIPRMSFTWLVAMMIEAADVKPTDTGPDIKSSKNPNCSRYAKNKLN